MEASTVVQAHASSSRKPICAIDPLSLIINEIILVTSAMRKSARWASSGVAAILGGSYNGDEEDEGLAVRWGLRRGKKANQSAESTLMAEFSKLRAELADCKGMHIDYFVANVEILRLLTCHLCLDHSWPLFALLRLLARLPLSR
jgi:hypothetical protein